MNDMSLMKQSELWKMTVDDRGRSILKSERGQKGKDKGKGDKGFLHDFLGFLVFWSGVCSAGLTSLVFFFSPRVLPHQISSASRAPTGMVAARASTCTKPTKTAGPRLTCRSEVMRQGRNSHRKTKIKMRSFPKRVRSDKLVSLRISLRLTSHCADSGWHVLHSTSGALPKVFIQFSHQALPTRNIVVPDRFRPGSAPSFNHSMYVCTGQTRMMLTYTPRRLTLGIHLPEVDSRSLRELKIFGWSCFRRELNFSMSLDGPMSRSDDF